MKREILKAVLAVSLLTSAGVARAEPSDVDHAAKADAEHNAGAAAHEAGHDREAIDHFAARDRETWAEIDHQQSEHDKDNDSDPN